MMFDDLDDFDRDDDFISGTCPVCSRTIYTESACETTCHHCGWTNGEKQEEESEVEA